MIVISLLILHDLSQMTKLIVVHSLPVVPDLDENIVFLLIYMDHQSCITCLFLQTMHKCILHKRLQCQRKDPRLHVHIRVDRQFRRNSVSKPVLLYLQIIFHHLKFLL